VPAWAGEAGIVALLSVAVAVAMTWPLVLHLGTRIPGGGTFYDPTGYYYDFWYFSTHGLRLLGTGTMTTVDLPFGRTIVPAGYLEQLFTYGPGVLISALWNPAAGVSLVALISVAASGGAMYGLVRWLGAGVIASGWAGIALMFSPYLTFRMGVHLSLVNVACIPLTLLAGLAWTQAPSLRRALLLALALAFAWLSDPYYGFMCLVIAIVVCAFGVAWNWRGRGARATVAQLGWLLGCIGVLVVVPLLVLLVTSGPAVQTAFTRGVDDLRLYGARLSDYVWPSQSSRLMHWLLGSSWHGTPGDERTVFLGWSTIALAVGWVVVAWRRWRALPARQRLLTMVAGPLVVVLVLLSLPSPYRLDGISVRTPPYLVWKLVPFIRAYGRFGIAVMVVVLCLAALAVDALLARLSRRAAILAGCGLVAVTVIELPVALPIASAPPVVANGTYGAPASQFAVWSWLAARRPDGTLLEMPTSSIEPYPYRGYMDRIYLYGQTIHHWPLANGGLGEASLGDDFGRLVGDPWFPGAASALATAGVTTVVVNPWAFREAGLVPPSLARLPSGFTPERAYPDGTVIWRVSAPALPGLAIPDDAFERDATTGAMVLEGRAGTVTVWAPTPGRYVVAFAASTRGAPGSLGMAAAGRSMISRSLTPGGLTTLRASVELRGHTTTLRLVRVGTGGAPYGPEVITQDWTVTPMAG